jgi:hypothetical protein
MPSRYFSFLLLVCWGHDKPPLQVAASNLRFGDGVTREVGMDLKNMKATKVSSVFIDVVKCRYDNVIRWRFSRTPTLPTFSL